MSCACDLRIKEGNRRKTKNVIVLKVNVPKVYIRKARHIGPADRHEINDMSIKTDPVFH